MRLKRWQRRSLGVIAGLSLGWFAAGLLPSAIGAQASQHLPKDESSHTKGQVTTPAEEELASVGRVPWLKPVLAGAVGLFAAAVALGIPAAKWKANQPPEPAPAHDARGGHGH